MASAVVIESAPDGTQFLRHVSTFDHMGREIKLIGYEGGKQTLISDRLQQNSLEAVTKMAAVRVVSNNTPDPRPLQGEFGERTGRSERRGMIAQEGTAPTDEELLS